MESIIIDLHNHINDIANNKMVDFLCKRFNNYEDKYQKIFGITEHFKDITKVKEYLKKLDKISSDQKLKERNISIIKGFELTISFDKDYKISKHMIVLCKDNNSFEKMFEYINLNCYQCNEDKIISNIEFANFFKEENKIIDNYIFIPHYTGKHKSFEKKELDSFYENVKTKIRIVEVANNYKTWYYADRNLNVEKKNMYHVICCTDRKDIKLDKLESLLTSFIYSDFSDNDAFNKLFFFFSQYDHLSHLSSNVNNINEFELPKSHAKISYLKEGSFILENTLIYGSRGSGKSYIADDLNSVLNAENSVSECCYIKQSAFDKEDSKIIENLIKNNEVESKITYIRNFLLKKLLNMELIDENHSFVLDPNKNFELFSQNIIENTKDTKNLDLFLKSYNFKIINKEKINTINSKYEIIKSLTCQMNTLIDTLNSSDENTNKVVDEYIDKSKKENLLSSLDSIYEDIKKKWPILKKEKIFIEKSHEIINELNKSAMRDSDWKYYFDGIDLLKAFKTKKIVQLIRKKLKDTRWKIDILNDKIKKLFQDDYCVISYELTVKKEEDWKSINNSVFNIKDNSYNLVINNNLQIKASGGQKKEFFVFNSICKDMNNRNIKYLILDESDYSFDSQYILTFASHIFNILEMNKWKLILITHNHILWSSLYKQGLKFIFLKTYVENYKYQCKQAYELNKDEMLMNFESNDDMYKYRGKIYGYRNEKE